MSTTDIKPEAPIYTKLKVPNGPIVSNPNTAYKGTVIGLSENSIIIRDESDNSLIEIKLLNKEIVNFKVSDKVQFSEHGVLTEHSRLQKKPVAEAKRPGCTRIPHNL